MSARKQMAALERAIQSIRPKKSHDNPPPERGQFMKDDGYVDVIAWRKAVDSWSMKVFGKPLREVGEQIAEDEGF